MRIVEVITKDGTVNFLSLLKQKQRELKRKKRGTFFPVSPSRWKHVSYSGYINLHKGLKHICFFEFVSKSEDSKDWQILHSFLGFLDRHFHEEMESVTVLYRD
jgi:hypothetical protein